MSDRRTGATITEAAVALAAVTVLLAVALPVLGGGKGNAGVQQSMANLITIGLAHAVYAGDWNGRQVTWTRDDLGFFGSIAEYNAANMCPPLPNCHPPIVAGWGETSGGGYGLWAYWSNQSTAWAFEPIRFTGSGTGFGSHRLINAAPFHYYLDGRYQDPIYYAPNDAGVMAAVEGCFGFPGEFVPECNPAWSSYSMSPAAMLHPDVMGANLDSGFQSAWDLGYGFESPGFLQATYPDLKTLMLEHHWVQNPPAPCNPNWSGDCEPYYFNHGFGSAPVTLFYDGHVRLLPNSEVLLGDTKVLAQTGGEDGLWHRGTPFGSDGYFIAQGYDSVPLSHHILTTGGILGRDTLGGMTPQSTTPAWDPGRPAPPHFSMRRNDVSPAALFLYTPNGGEP